MLNTSLIFCGPHKWKKLILCTGMLCGFVLFSFSVGAAEPSIPWQCTSYTYTGSSQAECIKSLSDPQQLRIADLEKKLKRQEILINELKNKIDRQSRRQARDIPASSPPYNFVPPLPLRVGPPPIYGQGAPFGFGIGPFPFLPPLPLGVGLPSIYGQRPFGFGVRPLPFVPPIAIVID